MTDSIGAFVIDVEGKTLTPEDRELLMHPLVGGVILFTRNYESREQLRSLCHEIRRARKEPLLIMADQEGGRVQRFRSEFTKLPAMGTFGELYQKDPQTTLQYAKDCGWLMATELLSIGIDLSLAPVLDMNKKMNNVIGDRAFHANSNTIIEVAQAFIHGMHDAGMAATGKHFPGHGSVTADSHTALPIDTRSLEEVEKEDMVPFTAMIMNNITAIMAAHITFPNIDEYPVGYSKYWLQEILRKRLGFQGIIISDDLNMEGANISSDYKDRFLAARNAGCDLVLLCNNRAGVISVLDHTAPAAHKISQEKWETLKGRFTQPTMPFEQQPRWKTTREFLHRIM